MSRGPGKIERAIEAAMRAEPDRLLVASDLCTAAYYPDVWAQGQKWGGTFTPDQRRSARRAARKVAKRLGIEIDIQRISKKNVRDFENGHRSSKILHGRFARYAPAGTRAKEVRGIRETRRKALGLPPDPTPELLDAERQAAAARRQERYAKIAKVHGAMTKEALAQFEVLKERVMDAEAMRAKAVADMQALVLRTKGLDNIAAGVFRDAGGDVEKALEMIADRMSD
jgi:chromosome segregation ATPase